MKPNGSRQQPADYIAYCNVQDGRGEEAPVAFNSNKYDFFAPAGFFFADSFIHHPVGKMA